MKAKVRANANIALVKYWGKQDEYLAIPNNSSLSLTLDKFYTETEVEFKEDLAEDIFYLDGKQDDKNLVKVSRFIDLFRNLKGINTKAIIKSYNFVPTAAGLASSASAYAALGGAVNEALNLKLDLKELSTYVRRGSGSASRSLYGGLVQWHKGVDDKTCYAEKVDDANFDIAMIAIVVNSKEKSISSRAGMRHTLMTSPFYKEWPNEAERDLIEIKQAIKDQDVKRIGEIAERNAMKMHATMMSANPPIIYLEPDSLKAINIVKKLRDENITAYYTMDAGPNVKIVCKLSEAEKIKEALLLEFSEENIIISKPGSGIQVI